MADPDKYKQLPPADDAMKLLWRLTDQLHLTIQDVYRGPSPDHQSFVGSGILSDGSVVTLKAAIRPAGNTLDGQMRDFTKEWTLYRLAPTLHDPILKNALPTILDQGIFEDRKWVMYRALAGQTFGGPLYLRDELTEEWREPISHFLTSLHTSTSEIAPQIPGLRSRKADFYREHLVQSLQRHWDDVARFFPGKTTAWLFELFDDAAHSLDQAQLVLAHGDLHPGNFFHEDNYSFTVIDWEKVYTGNPLADATYLWVRFWRAPWRDQVIHQVLRDYPATNAWRPIPALRYLVASQLVSELHSWQKEANWSAFPLKDQIEHVLDIYAHDLADVAARRGLFGE